MKKIFSALFLLGTFAVANAQSVSFKASTGDKELDVAVSDINKQGTADFNVFKKDLAVEFKVSESKINDLSVKFKMQPGDIYLALEIAKQTNKTVDQVAKSWEVNKSKGWGAIAKDLGIKPGSKEFHALKNAGKGKSSKMKSNGNSGKGNPGKKEVSTDTESKGNGNGKGNGKGRK